MAADTTDTRRYAAAAIILHWIIAAMILIQLGSGWYMNEVLPDHSPAQDRVQDIHVSIGLTILLLVLIRIGVRLANRPPPLPKDMPAWERGLAHLGHALFYVLLLALPLTGWALVSIRHEDIPFWGLPAPALPVLPDLGLAERKAIGHQLKHIHIYILIWIVVINLALHVAGALKHQFDGHPVLWRMAPWLKPRAARGG
jgi:cytochrome b561